MFNDQFSHFSALLYCIKLEDETGGINSLLVFLIFKQIKKGGGHIFGRDVIIVHTLRAVVISRTFSRFGIFLEQLKWFFIITGRFSFVQKFTYKVNDMKIISQKNLFRIPFFVPIALLILFNMFLISALMIGSSPNLFENEFYFTSTNSSSPESNRFNFSSFETFVIQIRCWFVT